MNSWEYRTPDPEAPRWPCVILGLLCVALLTFAFYLAGAVIPSTTSESAGQAAMEAWKKK